MSLVRLNRVAVCTLSFVPLVFASNASAEFASSAQSYTQGTVEPAVTGYNTPSTATGEPSRVAISFFGPITPFNPPFEPNQMAVVGVGGQITLELPSLQSIASGDVPQIGIFHSAGLNDPTFSGQAEATARTFSGQEYAADRTAIVEVADTLGNFHSIGRVVFTQPTQGFANQTDPYVIPDSPVPSDFNAAFTGSLTSYDGKSQPQISAMLGGSAGGTWIDVPAAVASQVTGIRYVRISDPLWQVIGTGALEQMRTSNFDPDGDGPLLPKVKPADIFVDGVNVLPEPSGAVAIALGALVLAHRRRR